MNEPRVVPGLEKAQVLPTEDLPVQADTNQIDPTPMPPAPRIRDSVLKRTVDKGGAIIMAAAGAVASVLAIVAEPEVLAKVERVITAASPTERAIAIVTALGALAAAVTRQK